MKIETATELFKLISDGTKDRCARKNALSLRKQGLDSLLSGNGIIKVAFDTRRIDQETEYNPRRGLQNYNRSEAFISEAISEKLKNLAKLKDVLDKLKAKYGREPEWQDSYARVLLNTLDSGLRTGIEDGDYTSAQPGVGSLDYIEELLHMRYRLSLGELSKMAESNLTNVILSKDEDLTRKDVNKAIEISKSDVANESYDTLMEKLFGGVKATQDNPEVERTITITIRDSIKDRKE